MASDDPIPRVRNWLDLTDEQLEEEIRQERKVKLQKAREAVGQHANALKQMDAAQICSWSKEHGLSLAAVKRTLLKIGIDYAALDRKAHDEVQQRQREFRAQEETAARVRFALLGAAGVACLIGISMCESARQERRREDAEFFFKYVEPSYDESGDIQLRYRREDSRQKLREHGWID